MLSNTFTQMDFALLHIHLKLMSIFYHNVRSTHLALYFQHLVSIVVNLCLCLLFCDQSHENEKLHLI